MNFKTTYILFGTLGAVILLVLAAMFYEPAAKDNSTYVLPSLHDPKSPWTAAEVDRVEIKRTDPESTLVFTREQGSDEWRISKPADLPANRNQVVDLISNVIGATREKADKPASLKDWGLDSPRTTLTLGKGDKSVSLQLGESSPGETNAVTYVLSSDKPGEPMAVRKRTLEDVFKPVNFYRERTLLTSATSDIDRITIRQGARGPVTLEKQSNQRWRYVQPPYGDAEVDGSFEDKGESPSLPSGVRHLLTALTNLKVDYKDDKNNDFVDDEPKDMGKYGLDAADILRIEIDNVTKAGKGEDGKEDKKTAKVTLLIGKKADEKGEKYFAAVDGPKKQVVKVEAKYVDYLRKLLDDPAALRDKTLVRFDSFAKPDAVTIRNGYGLLEFRQVGEGMATRWMLYRGDDGRPVEERTVEDFITLFTQANNVRGFASPSATEADLGLAKPEFEVSFWVNGLEPEKKPEKDDKDKKEEEKDKKDEKKEQAKPKLKKPDEPNVRLIFGNRDGELVYVKRVIGKDSTIVKVSDKLLDEVKRGPLFYQDKTLPSFAEGGKIDEVTKLTIKLPGGRTVEVARKDKDDPWKIVQPAAQEGKIADVSLVNSILHTLNRPRAVRLVSEKATDDALAGEYGLKDGATVVTVTVGKDKDAKTYDFLFGREDGEKKGLYAKQGWRDLVYVSDKQLVERLGGDFQDLEILKLDVSKIDGVKLTGWQTLLGSPLTIDLERSEGSWKAKAPPDFKLDTSKVRNLLDDLARLRAEKFIGHKTDLKPEWELDLAKGALVIELTIKDEKEPVRLTIGKADGDNVYATTNKLPGDVFLIRKAPFEKAKEKPAYFNP